MNIRFDGEIPIVYCHECNEDIDVSDLVDRKESGLHCKKCNAHLGFIEDLPEKFRSYLIRG